MEHSRKRNLKGLIRDQWKRIAELSDDVDALYAEFQATVQRHCEATIYMMGTAQVAYVTTFHTTRIAYDNYVKRVHELGYAQMSLTHKTECLGRAQDRYNMLVIELEDMINPPATPQDSANADDMGEEYICDELDAMDPPPLRAARLSRKKSRSKK